MSGNLLAEWRAKELALIHARNDWAEEATIVANAVPPGMQLCLICRDPLFYSVNAKAIMTRCGHFSHEKCFDGWMMQKRSCPICRLACDVESKESKR